MPIDRDAQVRERRRRGGPSRSRSLAPFYIAAAFVVAAVVVGGLVGILLAFSGLLIAVDRLVPDFHTPLLRELPASKRERLRGGGARSRAKR